MSKNQHSAQDGWWAWALAAAALLAGALYWLLKSRLHGANIQPVNIDLSFTRPPSPAPFIHLAPAAPEVRAVPVVTEPEMETDPASPDDLTVLIGVGPKIAAVLKTAGIETFAKLEHADPQALKDILQAANVRLANPASWPEQARLAAAGKWEEMKEVAARFKL
jgi:predicted flap endonuclease-1-like 5' DNA nuclease